MPTAERRVLELRRSPRTPLALAAAAAAVAGTCTLATQGQSGGYGYGAGQQQSVGYGGAQQSQSGGGDLPPGVGYNNPGGELSRADLEQQAVAPEMHVHMVGSTAAGAVGVGGGPPIDQGGQQPGYVQAKFVTPYGNATVSHHYGPGYPPPLGQPGGGTGGGGLGGTSGNVAGNPGLVNWGTIPAYTREELGNGVWFAGASGVSGGNAVPYVGSFND